jgi:glucose-6-phosphate dehydrogenase assembly protein OpcA
MEAVSATSEYARLGREVSIAEIEKAFAELWENDEASTKATLLNLVCFSTKVGSLLENDRLAAELTRDHACRVLLIEATPGAETRAWISAHCHLSGGKKSVCSEQIALHLDRDRPGLARNTLLGLLPSDLPVVLWWQGPLDDAFEPGLYSHVDRLLVDSAGWEFSEIPRQLAKLTGAREKMGRPFAIHDLAWTRTYQFRIAVAALFDHPHAQALMNGFTRVEIGVASGYRACGALLAAWISRSMGWTPAGALPEGWTFHKPTGESVEFFCGESEDSAPVGRLELRGPAGAVTIQRSKGDCHLCASIEDGAHLPPLMLPAHADSLPNLVAEMLSRGGKNSLYAAVLPVLLEMGEIPAPS